MAMLTVYNIDNPFDFKLKDIQRHELPDGLSPRLAMARIWPGLREFEYPTLCLVNGEPIMRSAWNNGTHRGSTMSFVRLAGEPTTIVIAVVAVLVAVAAAVFVATQNPAAIGAADKNGEQRNGATVYSLNGERNQNRLNSSIECAYGRNRLWPSYAARPYNTYNGNEQFQYSLFCLGHGSFSIERLQFEDTPIQGFDDVEFELVNPGESFDLFSDNVNTSTAVSNIELFGPNEPEFAGAVGPYVANAPFTKAHRLEVDVSLPTGLYRLNDENDLLTQEVVVQFQYQSINDDGNPTGPWRALVFSQRKIKITIPNNDIDVPIKINGVDVGAKTQYDVIEVPYFAKTLKTLTPQRFTLSATVPPGRYQVKAQRVNKKNTAINAANVVKWETLRAYLPSVKLYGGVTLIAIKARATNNLNNNAAQRFNVIATRKLPTWNGTAWTAPVATRNPIWAFCDIFRANYGGRLPDTFLDLVELRAFAIQFQATRQWFDYIFDQKTTVWEAARAVARTCRGVPMLTGSQITLIRDVPRSVATHVFNANNIVAGSFSWEVKLRNIQDHDGIEVEYFDLETFQPETVVCLIGSDLGDNPQTIKLPGCSDRGRAYQEGLYMRAVELFSTESITFKTGLEGHLPRYGDLILVSHDVPRWGQGGFVRTLDGINIELSEPVVFTPGAIHKLVLRKKDGTAYGPVTVTAGATPTMVVVNPAAPAGSFFIDNDHEPPYFLFGVEGVESKRCTVVGIQPEGEDIVTLKCAAYDDRVFAFAGAPTPAKYAPPLAVIDPARPVVGSIVVKAIPGTNEFVQVSWPPALGARTYVLDQSNDAIHWDRVATLPSTFIDLRIKPGVLYLRVAGVNVDIGPFATWQGTVGPVAALPGTVAGLFLKSLGPGFATVGWTALAHADSYTVSVFEKPSGKFLRIVSTLTLDYTYTLADGAVDGLVGRLVLFRVRGVSVKGQSADPAVLTVTIPNLPIAVINLTCDNSIVTADSSIIRCDHS